MGNSLKGKADLWRTGKDGSNPGKRTKLPGGGDDFQAPADYRRQYKGGDKTGGGGMNAPAAADNRGVFANSIAGLAASDKPFLPNPGSGRTGGLDMYSIKSDTKETEFGLDMGKSPRSEKDGF